jgi:type II secretory pathway pseudopilin PulG
VRKNLGFSLIELLTVLLLVILLSATAMPTFQWVHRRTQERLIADNLRQIWNLSRQYRSEFGVASVPIDHLIRFEGKILVCGSLRDPSGNPLPEGPVGVLKCVGNEDYTSIQSGFLSESGAIHWPESSTGRLYENAVDLRIVFSFDNDPSYVTLHL